MILSGLSTETKPVLSLSTVRNRRNQRRITAGTRLCSLGGGAESLLALAQLRQENTKPLLVGYSGPGWTGSDPGKTTHKFELEEKTAAALGLQLVRINTSLFELIYQPDWDWREYLAHNIRGIIISALHLPFMFLALMPIAKKYDIGRVVSGNETVTEQCKRLYCFSPKSAANLTALGYPVTYNSYLNSLDKIQVVHGLHWMYPQIAKYQYSCLQSNAKRWCLRCEKCLRNIIMFKLFNVNLTDMGINETQIPNTLPVMIDKAKHSVVYDEIGRKLEYDSFLAEAKRTNNTECLELVKQVYKGYYPRKLRSIVRARTRAMNCLVALRSVMRSKAPV